MMAASCVKGYDIVNRQRPERIRGQAHIIEEPVLEETNSCCETRINIFQKQYS